MVKIIRGRVSWLLLAGIFFLLPASCVRPPVTILPASCVRSGVTVFPGAEGFGRFTPAGRGGRLIKVVNLNDSGAGSFRDAVSAAEPRIVVFEVGGEIRLERPIHINHPYLTIAGQTAPPPGITLSGYGIRLATHDVLIQHIFVRHTVEDGADALDVHRDEAEIPYNIVIDHVSLAWGNDEVLSFAPGHANATKNNVTFSNNIIAEGTRQSYGSLISDGTKNFSAIRNLWISNAERQPRIKGGVDAVLVNNLSYNVGSSYHTVVGAKTGPNHLVFVGNVYKDGPDSSVPSFALGAHAETDAGSMIYLKDNLADGYPYSCDTAAFFVDTPPVEMDGISLLPAARAERHVLANAGARPAERDGIRGNSSGDPVDERLVHEVSAGGGAIRQMAPSLPKLPQTRRVFEAPADPNGDRDGDGYTNIEELLHHMAARLEKTAAR